MIKQHMMIRQYTMKGLNVIFIFLLLSSCSILAPLPKKEKIAGSSSEQNKLKKLIQDLKGDKPTRDQARDAIITIGKPAIPLLAEELKTSNDFTLSWEAVNIMGYIGDREATPILVEQVLKAENPHVRWRSIWAISQLNDDERIIPELLKALREGDERVRWNAAIALSNMDRKEAVPVLKEGLRAYSEWTQWEAVNALGRVHDETTVRELLSLLKSSSDIGVRQETLLSLGRIGDTKAMPALIEALSDKSPDIRCRAALALGMMSDQQAVPILEEHLKGEKDPVAKEYMQDALKSLKGQVSSYGQGKE